MRPTVQPICGFEVEFGILGPYQNLSDIRSNCLDVYIEVAKGAKCFVAEDSARAHLPNGSQFYIDDYHPEMASAERGDPVLAARTAFADRRTLNAAIARLNKDIPKGHPRFHLIANNVDGDAAPWACHINHMIDPNLLDYIENRTPILNSVSVSRMPLIGSGSFTLRRYKPHFEISQRTFTPTGDFRANKSTSPYYMRLSDHTAETTMSEQSAIIAAGVTSAVLAMIQNGIDLNDLVFESALSTGDVDVLRQQVSDDLEFTNAYKLINGKTITILEHANEVRERINRYFEHIDNPFRNDQSEAIFLMCLNKAVDQLTADHSPGAECSRDIDWLNKLTLLNAHAAKMDVDWDDPELIDWARRFNVAYHDIANIDSRMYGGRVFSNSDLANDALVPAPETSASGRMLIINQLRETDHALVDWHEVNFTSNGSRTGNKILLPDPANNTADQIDTITNGQRGAALVRTLVDYSRNPNNPIAAAAELEMRQRKPHVSQILLRPTASLYAAANYDIEFMNARIYGFIESNPRNNETYVCVPDTTLVQLQTTTPGTYDTNEVLSSAKFTTNLNGTTSVSFPGIENKVTLVPIDAEHFFADEPKNRTGPMTREQMLDWHQLHGANQQRRPDRDIDF